MKKFYVIANLVLLSAAFLLLAGHFSFRPSPPDKALKRTPQPMVPAGKPIGALTFKLPAVAELQNQNLFEPGRGKPSENAKVRTPSHNQPQLELVGICCFGETFGAIIVEKGNRNTAHGGYRGDNPKVKKRYFKQGEEVADGFCLNAVEADKVVLARGQEKMELKIGRERSMNVAQTPKLSVVAPHVGSQQVGGGPSPSPRMQPYASNQYNKPPNLNMPPSRYIKERM